jgi:hypothetical protein
MLHTLMRHPESVGESVTRVDVDVVRRAAHLTLRYLIYGDIAAVRIPAFASGRADALWQHTCCEAFIKPLGDAYIEFNLSPSTQWAAYRFDAYRAGMISAPVIAPAIVGTPGVNCFALQATIDCTSLVLPDAAWRIGATAVIEEISGGKSYWALAHAPGKPDFHHAVGFAIELGP